MDPDWRLVTSARYLGWQLGRSFGYPAQCQAELRTCYPLRRRRRRWHWWHICISEKYGKVLFKFHTISLPAPFSWTMNFECTCLALPYHLHQSSSHSSEHHNHFRWRKDWARNCWRCCDASWCFEGHLREYRLQKCQRGKMAAQAGLAKGLGVKMISIDFLWFLALHVDQGLVGIHRVNAIWRLSLVVALVLREHTTHSVFMYFHVSTYKRVCKAWLAGWACGTLHLDAEGPGAGHVVHATPALFTTTKARANQSQCHCNMHRYHHCGKKLK